MGTKGELLQTRSLLLVITLKIRQKSPQIKMKCKWLSYSHSTVKNAPDRPRPRLEKSSIKSPLLEAKQVYESLAENLLPYCWHSLQGPCFYPPPHTHCSCPCLSPSLTPHPGTKLPCPSHIPRSLCNLPSAFSASLFPTRYILPTLLWEPRTGSKVGTTFLPTAQ